MGNQSLIIVFLLGSKDPRRMLFCDLSSLVRCQEKDNDFYIIGSLSPILKRDGIGGIMVATDLRTSLDRLRFLFLYNKEEGIRTKMNF